MRVLIFFLFLSVILSSGYSQTFTGDHYYMFPINPGSQNYLAGSMGELRSSHFHAGLDIKTGGKIGLAVYAAASGYVSRIKVSTSGYGNALYIAHPNGTTTVYAHLEAFAPHIQEYVLQQQYEEESFKIELFPEKDRFPVRRGEVVAYSGNTGSSSGPHLHFEIRDQNQRILDPLKFNFSEIRDHMPPLMKNIAFVTLDGDARVNDSFGRYDFEVIKVEGKYRTRVPIRLKGNIGVEIYAYDLMDGVYSRNGIPEITLMLDEDTVFSQFKNNLSFDQMRTILVHMNYPAYREKGIKYNKLYVDDGNTNHFYTKPSHGLLVDENPHVLKIYMKDSYNNITTFECEINNRRIVNRPDPAIDRFEVFRNYLHFKSGHDGVPKNIGLYFSTVREEILPYRIDRKTAYYLWDLRDGLPDSIDYCGETLRTNFYANIPSGSECSFYNHDVEIDFRQHSLFDTLYLRFEKSFDPDRNLELFKFPHAKVPMRASARITLKTGLLPNSKSHVYSVYGDRLYFQGGEWEDSSIVFYPRDLVTFTIAQDSIPPVLRPVIINRDQVYFKINDGMSGIRSFRATLDGKFLLMKYEYKKDLIWSEKLDPNVPFKGELKVEVEDNAGNITTYQKIFD